MCHGNRVRIYDFALLEMELSKNVLHLLLLFLYDAFVVRHARRACADQRTSLWGQLSPPMFPTLDPSKCWLQAVGQAVFTARLSQQPWK